MRLCNGISDSKGMQNEVLSEKKYVFFLYTSRFSATVDFMAAVIPGELALLTYFVLINVFYRIILTCNGA
jgi:hypothetical protein